MKALWKQSGVAAMADVGALSPLGAAGLSRRARLFLYGFALAFAAFTAYLAFSSSSAASASPASGGGGGSPPASGWFTPTAPYRSQISEFFSSIFPTNSSAPSPERRSGGVGRRGGSDGGDAAARGEGKVDRDGSGTQVASAVGSSNSSTVGSHKQVGNKGGSGRGAPSNNAGGGNGSPADNLTGIGSAPAKDRTEDAGVALKNNSAADGGAAKSGGGAPRSNSASDGAAGKSGAKDGSVSISQAGSESGVPRSGSAGKGRTEKADVNSVVGSNNQSSIGAGIPSSGDAGNGSTVKADLNIGSNNQSGSGSGVPSSGSTGNGSAVNANDSVGGAIDTKTDLNSGSDNQSGSGGGASNNTAAGAGLAKTSAEDGGIEHNKVSGNVVPINNGTGSSKDGGIQSQGGGAPHKKETLIVSPSVKHQNQTGNRDASSGSGGAVNKKKEATPSPQGSAGSLKNHSSQASTSKATNYSSVLVKGNGSLAKEAGNSVDKKVDWIKAMAGCDIFHGKWVQDNSYPLYHEGSCPHIDEPFDCYLNGRPDRAYQKLRWQPSGCSIPRLNPTDMLERLRGKRVVFVGDSLNRNMWESLVCILRNSVKDKRKVFEASGRHEFKTEGSYSFLFTDYNCSVEFFRSPFLVQEWEMPISNGKKKETLRLDIIEHSSPKYKDADFIIFNTGHWWTHEKTSLGKDYYQEGNHVYSELNVVDAFHKALSTWAKWIDANVNPKKTAVFFRGYSASHFSGGQWNSGGSCDKETEPITNEQYLSSYPPKMNILEDVIHRMKTPVVYLNITRMTDYRKDAHPSVYRKRNLTEEERRSPERFQDCSHWCLPGVPDSWNELLYAQLLIKQHQMLQR